MNMHHSIRKTLRRNGSGGFKPGDTVVVFSIRVFGRPVIEGNATIIGRVSSVPDFYRVRFDGEARTRKRLVYRELQANPERMLAIMVEQWLAGMTPEVLEEFFPEDLL